VHGVARKTADTAGGRQLAGGQDCTSIDGLLVVLLGDPVEPHGSGLHGDPHMVQGSPFVRVAGIPVCREGHLADCGHPTTGSDYVRISE